jgi:hypothetical protein
VPITDQQLKNIQTGDSLVRNGDGTATVRNVLRATNGQVALEIESYWDDGETRIVKGTSVKNQFAGVEHD